MCMCMPICLACHKNVFLQDTIEAVAHEQLHPFLEELVKLDPRLTVLKIFMIFREYCS